MAEDRFQWNYHFNEWELAFQNMYISIYCKSLKHMSALLLLHPKIH